MKSWTPGAKPPVVAPPSSPTAAGRTRMSDALHRMRSRRPRSCRIIRAERRGWRKIAAAAKRTSQGPFDRPSRPPGSTWPTLRSGSGRSMLAASVPPRRLSIPFSGFFHAARPGSVVKQQTHQHLAPYPSTNTKPRAIMAFPYPYKNFNPAVDIAVATTILLIHIRTACIRTADFLSNMPGPYICPCTSACPHHPEKRCTHTARYGKPLAACSFPGKEKLCVSCCRLAIRKAPLLSADILYIAGSAAGYTM